MTDEQHAALVETFVRDLRERADATDDPNMLIGLTLHASAGITADLGPIDIDGVRVS